MTPEEEATLKRYRHRHRGHYRCLDFVNPVRICEVCHCSTMKRLCDATLADGQTCDFWMCENQLCSQRIGDKDYCPTHRKAP